MPIQTQSGRPETFGWVRAPAYDYAGGMAYERPDGRLAMFLPGVKPFLVRAGNGRTLCGEFVYDGFDPRQIEALYAEIEAKAK